MFSAMAKGKSEIYNCLKSEDVLSTIEAFEKLGVEIEFNDSVITVSGNGIWGLKESKIDLYMGNSGTTTRLLSGILAAQKFHSKLIGDPSLSKRPMQRIITPLAKMGAKIKCNDGLLPMEIFPVDSLNEIEYELPIASAQVKSCILLAGLFLDKATVVIETKQSRNHTEKMLELKVIEQNNQRRIYSSNKNYPNPAKYNIPSDISTAAFFIVLTLLKKDSELYLPDISLNTSRIGILDILIQMGAEIEFENVKTENGEKRGDIIAKSSELHNIQIPHEIIPNLIDEIPILSIAGLFAEGDFEIRGAKELRHKESDRITSVCNNLKLLGVDVQEFDDGFRISGAPIEKSGCFESYHDHRIAMSFGILSLFLKKGGTVNNFECVNISNPEFINQLNKISH